MIIILFLLNIQFIILQFNILYNNNNDFKIKQKAPGLHCLIVGLHNLAKNCNYI